MGENRESLSESVSCSRLPRTHGSPLPSPVYTFSPAVRVQRPSAVTSKPAAGRGAVAPPMRRRYNSRCARRPGHSLECSRADDRREARREGEK